MILYSKCSTIAKSAARLPTLVGLPHRPRRTGAGHLYGGMNPVPTATGPGLRAITAVLGHTRGGATVAAHTGSGRSARLAYHEQHPTTYDSALGKGPFWRHDWTAPGHERHAGRAQPASRCSSVAIGRSIGSCIGHSNSTSYTGTFTPAPEFTEAQALKLVA
jgi:hypothetical protein